MQNSCTINIPVVEWCSRAAGRVPVGALTVALETIEMCPTHAPGKSERKKPKVLFLSTGNAARSQMAEGFLRALGNEHFDVMSAGVKPSPLNPLASEVMKEKGIDISKYEPKNVDQSLLKEYFAYVITLSDTAKERSPIFPFTTRLMHWSIKDPAAAEGSPTQKIEAFRGARDEIESKIKQFIAGTAKIKDSQLLV